MVQTGELRLNVSGHRVGRSAETRARPAALSEMPQRTGRRQSLMPYASSRRRPRKPRNKTPSSPNTATTSAAMAMPSGVPEGLDAVADTGAVGVEGVSVSTGAGVSGFEFCGEATWIHRTTSPEEYVCSDLKMTSPVWDGPCPAEIGKSSYCPGAMPPAVAVQVIRVTTWLTGPSAEWIGLLSVWVSTLAVQ